MYDRILLPTDGSEAAANAAEHAYSLAEQYGADLHVLYVVEEVESASIVGRGEGSNQSVEERASEATADLVETARERGIDATGVARSGDAHHEIVSYAAENDVDVVVMSTHGRSGVDKLLMGSVTDRVLRKSDVPVLVIRR